MKHGGDLAEAIARYGADDPPWLDLSTGINPHPWPLPERLRAAGWERLPSRAALDDLLGAARIAYAIPTDAGLVAAPGTQALIQWLPRLAPLGEVAIVGPTYSEHEAAWHEAGFQVTAIPALDVVLPAGIRHLVVVSPNNPDGRVASLETLVRAAERCAAQGGWLIVDQSFADADSASSAVDLCADLPVIVLRSFGKFYGLAGLRLGFAIAPRRLAEQVERALGPWAVSGPALAVGGAALADRGWAAAMRERLAREATALEGVLACAGLDPVGGTSLFRLARHPGAAALHTGLAARHIWTRRFDWAGDLIRFGLPPDVSAVDRLRASLAQVLLRPDHAHGTSTV